MQGGNTSEPAGSGEAPAGSKLVVGPNIKLKGVEITECDTLIVEGRVEASMDSRVVQIAEHGVFSGTATMDLAEVWGRFEGRAYGAKASCDSLNGAGLRLYPLWQHPY